MSKLIDEILNVNCKATGIGSLPQRNGVVR